MGLSRRDLLAGSALILTQSASSLAGLSPARDLPPETRSKPIILCWNENPYGPGPAARAALSRTIGESCRYPDAQIDELVQAIADHEGVSPASIVVGSGSGELLRALGMLHG